MQTAPKHLAWLILLAALCGAAPLAAQPAAAPLKVAAILPLSGEFAGMGREIQRGIELGIAQHGSTEPMELEVEDMQSMNLKAAASAAQQTLNVARAAVGLCVFVDDAQVIGPIFNKAEVPLLILWDSSDQLRSMGRYVFSNGFSTEFAGAAAARFAHDALRLRSAALVQHESSWGDIISDAFRREFERLGGRIAYHARLPLAGADFRTAALQISARRADGVYFPLSLDGAAFLKELQRQHTALPLISADTMVVPGTLEAAGSAAEGVVFTSVYSDHADEISRLYRGRFREEPSDPVWVSFGYDGVQRLTEARRVQRASGGSLADALLTVFGPRRSAERQVKFFRVQGGKPAAFAPTERQ